jgi:predicted transcriptional regulator
MPSEWKSAAGRGVFSVFGDLERRVLEALWEHSEPVCVRELCAAFPSLAYTTLMTTLDRLYRKGVLERFKSGRAYAYTPRHSREELEGVLAADAVRALFARGPGAIRPALSFLVDAVGHTDARLLDELEALVRERRRRDEEPR